MRELSFAELVAVLWRRRWLVLAGIALGAGAGAGVSLLIPPVYTAQALLLLAPKADPATPVPGAPVGLDGGLVDSQLQILASRSLAREVVAQLDLAHEPELTRTDAGWHARLRRLLLGGAEEAAEGDLVGRFLDHLSVQREGRSYVVRVAFRADDPDTAARVANKLAELYLVGQLAQKYEAVQRGQGWLADQLAGVKGQLDAAQVSLQAYRQSSQRERGEGFAVEPVELAELNRQLVLAHAERSERETKLNGMKEALDAGEPSGLEGGSVLLQNLYALKAQLLRREAEMTSLYGERHPKILDIRAEKTGLDDRIAQEQHAILRGLEGEVGAARSKEQTLARSLEDLKGKALREDEATRRSRSLERDVELNRGLYESLLQRTSSSADRESIQEPDARVISEAVPPQGPSFPKPRLVLSLGLSLGLSLALGLTYLLESRDQGLHTAQDVQALLHLPTVALVPEITGTAKPLPSPQAYVLERPRSRYAESLREVLATLLLGAGPDRPGQAVLLTSVLPDEGKSTLTLSLGRLAAGEGLKVLLIDADLRRPSLHDRAGLKPGPGLVEALQGEIEAKAAYRQDPRSGLILLTGNGRLSQPTRILAPDGLGRLLKAARTHFNLILIDSAPLGAVADARLMAALVDRTLLLVRHGATSASLAAHCLATLPTPPTGVILTRVDLKRHKASLAADAGFAYTRLAHYYAD